MVDDEAIFILKLYRSYRQGFLLKEGGIANQPNVYFELMDMLDRWVLPQKEDKH